MNRFLISLIFLLVTGSDGLSDTDYSTEIQVPEKAASSSHLREKMITQATEKAATDLIKIRIGEKKYDQFREVIEKKIIPQSDNYFSIVKPGPLVEINEGSKMTVSFRVNEAELANLLRRNRVETDQVAQKGNTYRLRIFPLLSGALTEKLRDVLRRANGISSLKERLIEKTQMVYDVESSLSPTDLVQSLKSNTRVTSVAPKMQILEQDSEVWIKIQE